MCRDLAVFSISSVNAGSLLKGSSSMTEVDYSCQLKVWSYWAMLILKGETLATHFTVGNAYLRNHSGLWDCTHNLQGNRQIWTLGWLPRVKNSTYLSFLAQTRQVYTDPFPIPPPLPQQSIVPAVPIENVIQLELVNFPVSQTLQKSLINKEDIFLKVEDTF